MNSDFQRLLDDMDRALRRKHQELSELDERLETARKELSEKEAKEILSSRDPEADDDQIKQQDLGALLQEQRDHYEAKISSLTEELIETENSNQNLLRANGQLRFEIDSLRVSNEKLKNRAQTLNDNLDEVQSANFELNIRLAKAESQAQMQQNLLIKSHEQDQILMNAFNSKLESLKEAISRRDDEIRRLREYNQQTVQSEGRPEDETDLTSRTEDTIREDLTNSESVTRDNASWQNKRLAQESRKDERASLSAAKSIDDEKAHNDCDNSNEEIRNLEMRSKMLEVELVEKDRLIHSTEKQIHYFESIFPHTIVDLIKDLKIRLKTANSAEINSDSSSTTGQLDLSVLSLISDLIESLDKLLGESKSNQTLLNMVDQLQATILSKDRHIKRLVRELNVISADMNHDQIDAILIDDNYEATSIPITSTFDNANHESAIKGGLAEEDKETEVVSDEAVIDEIPRQQPETSEAESNQQSVNAGVESKSTVSETDLQVDEDGEPKVEKNEIKERSPPENQSDARSGLGVIDEFESDQSEYDSSEARLNGSHLNQFKDRLQQLEEENQMLELAMKEILLSIKWSDTKCSTILIDCPSLERLCQLIEARYLADVRIPGPRATVEINATQSCDLFQYVVMKSELDILRGQNEQLRTDLKLIRQGNQLEITTNSPRPSTFKRGALKQDVDDEYGRCEIECQTDSLILISPENLSSIHERRQSQEIIDDKNCSDKKEKCQNCIRLVRLANHLLDCIVRIEDRVNSSDESYISRLMTLYQLIQRLSKELSSKDSAINQLRREYHNVFQMKAHTEARCRAVENNFEIHSRVCPLSYTSPSYSQKSSMPSNGNPIGVVPSLTIHTNQNQVQVPLRDGRIAIALLQSIIGCLQARLDYKDERLAQLERMLVSS